MPSDERKPLLPTTSASSRAGEGATSEEETSSGYSSIPRVQTAGRAADSGFRRREYARLRRIVLVVTGVTTVLMAAGLLVDLLVPASVPGPPLPPTTVFHPVA